MPSAAAAAVAAALRRTASCIASSKMRSWSACGTAAQAGLSAMVDATCCKQQHTQQKEVSLEQPWPLSHKIRGCGAGAGAQLSGEKDAPLDAARHQHLALPCPGPTSTPPSTSLSPHLIPGGVRAHPQTVQKCPESLLRLGQPCCLHLCTKEGRGEEDTRSCNKTAAGWHDACAGRTGWTDPLHAQQGAVTCRSATRKQTR